jgi:hypothetical protein
MTALRTLGPDVQGQFEGRHIEIALQDFDHRILVGGLLPGTGPCRHLASRRPYRPRYAV